MRIDLIITELFVGGAERCLCELALQLHRGGDRVRVASIAPLPSGDQAKLVDALRDSGIEVHSTRCSRYWQMGSAYRSLRGWLSQDRPDVVQTMLYHANVLGTLAARAEGVRCRVGGLRVAERRRARLWIERRAIARMNAVVCVSDSVRQFAHREFGSTLPQCEVIPNAIDTSRVDSLPPVDWPSIGWPKDAQVLLFVGRLHPQKGLDILVQAVDPLMAKYPEMRCLIVGEGPLRSMLKKVAARWTPARFQLLGWRADALQIVKACRIVVLPSRYEGMPNVILEAMAAGKPVAVCRVEGIGELLGDDARSQTAPPEDADALRTVIDGLWRDPQTAQRLGLENRQRALAQPDFSRMALAYRQLYVSLLAARNTS